MDDSQKTQQQTHFTDQTQVTSSPITDDVTQNVSSQPTEKKEETPLAPVSAPSKEGGPSLVSKPETLIISSMPEMEVSPDLQKETGAEAVTEVPQLTPEDTQAGIVHAKESTPVSIPSTATIILPMTQQQSQQTVKLLLQ